MATEVSTDSIPCPVCKYPIPMPSYAGQEVTCAYCGSVHKAIAVQIPNPVFAAVVAFIAGVVLGPTIIAATKSGSERLARKAKERLER